MEYYFYTKPTEPKNESGLTIPICIIAIIYTLYSIYWLPFNISNIALWYLSNDYFYVVILASVGLVKYISQILWFIAIFVNKLGNFIGIIVFIFASSFLLCSLHFVFLLLTLLGTDFNYFEAFSYPTVIELGTFLLVDIFIIILLASKSIKPPYLPMAPIQWAEPKPRYFVPYY